MYDSGTASTRGLVVQILGLSLLTADLSNGGKCQSSSSSSHLYRDHAVVDEDEEKKNKKKRKKGDSDLGITNLFFIDKMFEVSQQLELPFKYRDGSYSFQNTEELSS